MINRPPSAASPAGTLPESVVIGTAGHIDHGKTALIRALTGIDTDRLPEEKRRGITIDLGFASLDIFAQDGSPIRISFIDVPGHARFVRNMLAGAGGIDAVLLVISAEEGVKPQTEEHLAICSILGIQCGATVLTKTDAVSAARLNEVRSSVERYLSTTFLARSPVICASAFTGEGLSALRRELGSLAALVPAKGTDRLTRLPVDRAFTIKGFGTVATGTLITGSIAVGQELTVQPSGRIAKVRGIQVHGRIENTARAATRAALNLSRIDASELRRGDTLVELSTIAVDTIDAEVTLLRSAPDLKHRGKVHFHAFASECMAAASLYGYRSLEPGSSGLVRLRLSKPIVLLPGDRFVLRSGSPLTTIGGGRTLDAHPVERLSKAKAQAWLEQVRNASLDRQLVLRVARRGTAGIKIATLSNETGLRTDAIQISIVSNLRDRDISLLGDSLLLKREAVDEAIRTILDQLAEFSASSGSSGVKKSELRSRTRLRPEVFDHVLTGLEGEKNLRIAKEIVFPATVGLDRSSRDRERLSAICRTFELAGLAAPSPANVAAELSIEPGEMRRLITILLRERRLVRLGDDSLCIDEGAVNLLKQRLQALRGQTLDVARFKQLTGVSRKYAIPLLEFLDRERITRKDGDHRIVL